MPARIVRSRCLIVLASALLGLVASAAAAAPALVRDINNQRVIAGSQPREFLAFGAGALFIATTAAAGDGLWKRDDNADATTLVHGFGSSDGQAYWLAALDQVVLFSAYDPVTGRELWRSNGTPDGTGPLADLNLGPIGSEPKYLTRVGARIFFSADDGTSGEELWVTDGSADGTHRVADIAAGPSSAFPFGLVGVGEVVFFIADDGEHGAELWRSDGSEAGTRMVRDVDPGVESGAQALVAAGDRLFFVGNDGEHGTEPWVSDGSELGTHLARDILPGEVGSDPTSLTAVGARVFFSAFAAEVGEELWISDGSEAGTRPAADVNPGPDGSFPFWLVAAGDRCFFTADDGESGEELWVSDGTPDGTTRVADLRPGAASSIPTETVAVGTAVFFNACADPGAPCGLWRTDGTAAGTLSLHAFVDSGDAAAVGPLLYLRADDGDTGSEPWRSDGSAAGTVLLSNVAPDDAVGSAYPTALTEFLRQVIFVADDGAHGEELWISGGTSASTRLVKDINPDGAAFGLLTQIARLGAYVFFAADDGEHGIELWRSDGTEAGTTLWEDVATGPASGAPRDLTPVEESSRLFFVADEGLFGSELWRTDNDGSTTPITDINPGAAGSNPRLLTPFRGGVAFTADDGTHGIELWVSNGTPRGTHLVRDINPHGSAFLPPGVFYLTVRNDILYFSADDGQHGVELWSSDGTEEGTRMVRDIRVGPASSDPQFLRAAGEQLALVADDGTHGSELWRSDGSEDGTALVADINPQRGAFGSVTFFFSFGRLGTDLYFAADDGTHGVELWRSDLTAAGTTPVADLNPGAEGSFPAFFAPRGDAELLFQAGDPTAGFEPWRVTADGTVTRLADLAAGPTSSNPTGFTVATDRVFFSADDGASGTELWIDAACAGDCGADGAVSIDELIRGVRIALGSEGLAACLAIDLNADGSVTIDELIAAVNAALAGC